MTAPTRPRRFPASGTSPGWAGCSGTLPGRQNKTNLLIFITPHIVRTAADMERATSKKKLEAEENLRKLRDEREKEVKDTFDMLVK